MSGILTRSQMVNEVLDNVVYASATPTKSGTTLDTLAIRYLNRAQDWIARKHDLLLTEGTAVTIASTQKYAFPSNLRSVYSMRLEDGTNSRKLICTAYRTADRYAPKPSSDSTGVPDYYIPFFSTCNEFELYPIPDAVYTVRMRYSFWPTLLTADAQTTDYTNLDDSLVAYATGLMYYWMQEYSDANSWFALAKSGVDDYAENIPEIAPDWSPAGTGFSTARPGIQVGDYWNNPWVIGNF